MLPLLAMPSASLTLIWLCKATRNLVGHRPWLSFLKQKCRKRVVIDSAPQNTEGLHCRQLPLSRKLSPSFRSAIVRYPLPMLRPTLLPYSVSCLLISLVSSTVSAKGIRSSMKQWSKTTLPANGYIHRLSSGIFATEIGSKSTTTSYQDKPSEFAQPGLVVPVQVLVQRSLSVSLRNSWWYIWVASPTKANYSFLNFIKMWRIDR